MHPRDFSETKLLQGGLVGKQVLSEEIPIKINTFRDTKDTVVDLRDYLQHHRQCLGNLAVTVEPTREACGIHVSYSSRPKIEVWFQCTSLTLSAFETTNDGPYAFVRSLFLPLKLAYSCRSQTSKRELRSRV